MKSQFVNQEKFVDAEDASTNLSSSDAEIQLIELRCARCQHKWIPRTIPKMCPKCKSYLWDKEKLIFTERIKL